LLERFGFKRLKPGHPPRVGYVPQVETVDWGFPVTAEEVVMMGRYQQQKIGLAFIARSQG